MVLALTSVVLSSCGSSGPEADVAKRTAYWRSILNAEVHPGETRQDVDAWLNRRLPAEDQASRTASDAEVVVAAETINDRGPACAYWVVLLEIEFANGHVSSRKAESAGECL
jgi:hypothetical protein